MTAMKAIERESEILNSLNKLATSGLDMVVVGGYAVTAVAGHRFSVDCDIVIPKAAMPAVERLLVETGYRRCREKGGFDAHYGGLFVRYEKEVDELPVSVDLLVGSLVNRSTGAAWSFEYVKQHAAVATIAGVQSSVICMVPKRELLIAMKIHSGRRTDVRDIVMLNEKADWAEVLEHTKRGNLQKLGDQLRTIARALRDEKLVDSLKGVFGLTKDVKNAILKTIEEIETLKERLTL